MSSEEYENDTLHFEYEVSIWDVVPDDWVGRDHREIEGKAEFISETGNERVAFELEMEVHDAER